MESCNTKHWIQPLTSRPSCAMLKVERLALRRLCSVEARSSLMAPSCVFGGSCYNCYPTCYMHDYAAQCPGTVRAGQALPPKAAVRDNYNNSCCALFSCMHYVTTAACHIKNAIVEATLTPCTKFVTAAADQPSDRICISGRISDEAAPPPARKEGLNRMPAACVCLCRAACRQGLALACCWVDAVRLWCSS